MNGDFSLKSALVLQNRALGNLFTSPNRIEDIAASLSRLERGDVKLRVRALDAERTLTRVTVRSTPGIKRKSGFGCIL